ncbi:LPS export ABC transporter periplasmic protein LptC [Amaricoccus sp.]|uniref:LPS export ABC transporter periplasmic protein LptC n=1 Tax=Amaricoccus sp. TaxID=1872485 RepID=UPI00261570DB|nr:LPS export ABC transporter periplasmic protein LptC [uncultured Amaricoccus sp.]
MTAGGSGDTGGGRDLRSRIVAILKVGLPLVALGMLSALFLIQGEDGPAGGAIQFSEGDMAALGSGLRVTNPTLTGTTEAEDRFRFTADLVVPDAAPPTKATMTRLTGEMRLADGPTVDLTAATGELDIASQRLSLGGKVRIDTSDGYGLRSEAMTVDLGKGVMEATEAVSTEGPMGRIDAGTLRVEPAGTKGGKEGPRLISFGNGVRLIYHPPSGQGSGAVPGSAEGAEN